MTGLAREQHAGARTGRPRLRAIDGTPRPAVRRVRKAYEQVADQLRELIVTGEVLPEERLPNETLLAREFGVSRPTIREALRVLATQSLIRTAKGAGGGSYVTMPSVAQISDVLSSNINLLTGSQELTLEELIEARKLLEVPAARLAARRRSAIDLERLREAIPGDPAALSTGESFSYNRDFHSVLVDASGNTLLFIAAQPIFSALQTHLARSGIGGRFHEAVNEQHVTIAEAIEAGDEDAAAAEMDAHLDFLIPFYEKAWRDMGRGSP
jgi:DNA-binding FadR family transcriptional regulator